MRDAEIAKYSRDFSQLFSTGNPEDASALCSQLLLTYPASIDAQLLASQAFQQLGKFDEMLDAATHALALDKGHIASNLRVSEGSIFCGQIDRAMEILGNLETKAWQDHRLLQEIAEKYLHCQNHTASRRCYQRAAELQPKNPHYLFNHASALVSHGEIEQAYGLFNDVIALSPDDFGAYQNRSMLSTWTHENNHVGQLNSLLKNLPAEHAGEVPLCFALAKEFEDLGEFQTSFEMLRRGADSRRKRLAYKVGADVDVMSHIRQVFDSTLFQKHEQSTSPAGALFILGLPRSGTTLVDRIVSSHSQVDSLGEINDFALALTRLSGGVRKGGKLELVDASARFDFSQLGQVYMRALASYGRLAPYLINKTPQNYLYIGLIHLAIAGAKIIHLRRHPLDTCYAMYKTLFRMGYPFSYSLDDIGHYYLAYHQLMQHWRDILPGVFLDVDYETIVAHKEKASREIIQYTNLPWEDACLDFHKNRAPAATASATQVRQDIYGSSVGKWKAYEKDLEPLASFLTKAGIDCG